MNPIQYQNIISMIRIMLTDGIYNAETSHFDYSRRKSNGEKIRSFNIHNYLPDFRLEIVYDTSSLYIIGYIIDNHGFRFRNCTDAFRTESGAAITQYSTLDVGNDYTDAYRSKSHTISVDELNAILKKLSGLKPGNNVQFDREKHQHMFVGFAEAVRFADILRDIVQGTSLVDLKTRLDWNKRSNASDKLVMVK